MHGSQPRSPKIDVSILCQFNWDTRDSAAKYYKPAPDPILDPRLNSVFERHCLTNSSQETTCTGSAVDTHGDLIMTSQLGKYGSEIRYDHLYLNELSQATGKFAFSILGIALGLYACIGLAVCAGKFKWWPKEKKLEQIGPVKSAMLLLMLSWRQPKPVSW